MPVIESRCRDLVRGKAMFGNSSRVDSFILIALAWGVVVGSASMSRAEASKPCGSWTLFPDFRCEGRDARPDDAFNPVGMPYLFEDPYITSNLNFAYVYHRLPDDGPLGVAFDGGGVDVLALQIRLALTENIAFIATKDGLAFLRPGKDALVRDATGVFDMTMGFKVKLFETENRNFIISPAIRYEIPMGTRKIFQNYGKGVFIPSASFRWGLGDIGLENANVVGSLGGQVPVETQRNVRSLFYNLHLDYGFEIRDSVVKFIVPFVEVNGIHYTSSSRGTNPIYLEKPLPRTLPLATVQSPAGIGSGPFEGFDVGNLGSPGISGKDVVTMGGGLRLPTTWGVSFAVMYEGAVTQRKDIHGQRFTFMATWEL